MEHFAKEKPRYEIGDIVEYTNCKLDCTSRIESISGRDGKFTYHLSCGSIMGEKDLIPYKRLKFSVSIEYQKRILDVAKKTKSFHLLSLREIARRVGLNHPQALKYHLLKMIKDGECDYDIK